MSTESQKSVPLLVQYLFGTNAEAAWSTAGEQLKRWSECFEAWLEKIQKKDAPYTLKEYKTTWRLFIQVVCMPPWEVRSVDVERWADSLGRSGQAIKTIRRKAAILSSFYRFAQSALSALSGELVSNPVEKPYQVGDVQLVHAGYLDVQETQALLDAARRGDSLLSKRNYAYFLSILKSGLGYQELRQLKWGDLSLAGGVFIYRPWQVRLPEDCSSAILAYLKDSGRWESLQPDHYVFTALTDHHTVATGSAAGWKATRPVRRETWFHHLREAVRWAGLQEAAINFHTLHNTALYLRIQSGESREQIAQSLHYASLKSANQGIDAILKQEKQPLWARPDPERQNQRHPKGEFAPEQRMILAPASPEELERLAEEAPTQALERGIEAEGELREALLRWMQLGVEDSQILFAVNRGVNRSAARIKRMAPAYKKYREYQAKESAEYQRIMEFVRRVEAHQRGEDLEEEEIEYKGL